MLNPNALNDNPTSLEARKAIRAIGTNALPCLLAWLSAEPDHQPTRQALQWAIVRLPNLPMLHSARTWAASDPVRLHFEIAAVLFKTLGSDAAPATPDLEHLASDPRGRRCAYTATIILSGIGPQALPALQRIANNPACPTRHEAATLSSQLLTNTPTQ
jgi:hypothetical protein